jgi:PDZ domain-containing secreted protein
MSQWRQKTLPALIVIVVMCSWCSLLSGVGGWFIGYDVGKREVRDIFLPETGVLVVRVALGSPAEQAGIGRGDLITAINGVTVNDVVELRNELLKYDPGAVISIAWRDEQSEREAQVSLDTFPGRNIPYLGIYYTARAEAPADL